MNSEKRWAHFLVLQIKILMRWLYFVRLRHSIVYVGCCHVKPQKTMLCTKKFLNISCLILPPLKCKSNLLVSFGACFMIPVEILCEQDNQQLFIKYILDNFQEITEVVNWYLWMQYESLYYTENPGSSKTLLSQNLSSFLCVPSPIV